jgi:hypothetical protein
MQFRLPMRWSWCRPITVEISAEYEQADDRTKLCAALKVVVDLHGKWLRGEEGRTRADLTRAVLTGADLTHAVLTRAVLTRADLTGADLTGADLTGADLTHAVLTDADLTGADLTDEHKLVGSRPLLLVGPIGSRADTLKAFMTNRGVMVATGPGRPGCFFGTLEQFRAQVERVHGDNTHGQEYRAAIALIEAHACAWLPAAEAESVEAVPEPEVPAADAAE